ncbi:MAG TPA: dihydrofolate reductase, partial [Ornithinibacter sp.]|nr:dihydrofolate reductase [Ornithinibacter sp.]
VESAHSFAEAVALAGPADEVFVAGGAQIYAEALPFAHRMLVTEVDAAPEGDTFFPSWARADWREDVREVHDGWSRVVYERVHS